jgi:fibronectin type 3 domain-containing protein
MNTRLLTAVASIAVIVPATAASASSPTSAPDSATVQAAATSSSAATSSYAWSQVYRNDFTDLRDVNAYQSSVDANSHVQPSDSDNSSLQKPTLSSNVVLSGDSSAADGKAMAVWTRKATYQTANGPVSDWTNGRMMIRGQQQDPPVRVRARIRMTASAKVKSAIMWWPTNGWPWEVDFAETFGGDTTTDYWGSRQHVSQRWHGDGPDADTRAVEQLVHNDTLDATRYHIYDLFVTPSRMWIEIDGQETFATTDKQFIPDGTGFFSIGKALTHTRGATGRTDDAVYVDWLEIYKGNASAPDTTAPAAPSGVTAAGSAAGAALSWTANSEPDLGGYNVYRSDTAAGPFTKLNTGVLAQPAYADAAAPAGATSYYQVTAVDTTGNESPRSATASATVPDTTAPASPAGLSAVGSPAGAALSWTGNGEPDLASYNVYRSGTATGPFTKLTSTAVSSFSDTAAPAGATSYYQVTAVDTSGNESPPSATASATVPQRTFQESAATYVGSWASQSDSRFNGAGSKYSKTPGSKAYFSFTGSSVRWITSKGPLRGTAKIWYDGVYQGTVDLASPTAEFNTVGWTSPVRSGTHKLQVYVAGSKRVDVDAFTITP